jgi:hypothetical protein
MPNNKFSAFSLVELVVAIALVGGLLAMVAGAVYILDRRVAGERLVVFPTGYATDAQLSSVWGYSSTGSGASPQSPRRPNFTLAPSRVADAQAEALWRQLHEIYEQSYAVGVIDAYVQHNFVRLNGSVPDPSFIGASGYLTRTVDAPLTQDQLSNPDTLRELLLARFPDSLTLWNHATSSQVGAVDQDSYRAATIFFLAPQDRILGILRMRAWQFYTAGTIGVTVPYRFYEVSLARLVWKDIEPTATENWVLDDTRANFVEDFSYRFVEDRRFPQDLIFPPTDTQLAAIEGGDTSTSSTPPLPRNQFVRLATAGESYRFSGVAAWADNTNPGVSRRQVSLAPKDDPPPPPPWDLRAAVDEWHVILPDPGLGQGEERARLRQQLNFNAIIDMAIRRQGKYGTIFKVFP